MIAARPIVLWLCLVIAACSANGAGGSDVFVDTSDAPGPSGQLDAQPDTHDPASTQQADGLDGSDGPSEPPDAATLPGEVEAVDSPADVASNPADGATNNDSEGDAHALADVDPAPWRSDLYPQDWTPSHQDSEGRYLHDFSYAGYHHGEASPAAEPTAAVFDVVADFGAPQDGASDATSPIQAAIDAAAGAGGGIVYLPPGVYRCDGGLQVTTSNTVVRGAGPDSVLWFTPTSGFNFGAHLELRGAPQVTHESALIADAASRADTVEVTFPTGVAPGDDVQIGWVITDDFIARHDMSPFWEAFNGTWQPFFHRTVVAVNEATTPPVVTLDVPLRYPALVGDGASLRRIDGLLHEVGVEDLAVTNAVGWEEAWAQTQVHAIALESVTDAWVRGVTSVPSPGAPAEGPGSGDHLQSSGLLVRASKRVSVLDSSLQRSQHRGGGGNGYLFEVRQSSEILFADCHAAHGRHNFIQNWSPRSRVRLARSHFG